MNIVTAREYIRICPVCGEIAAPPELALCSQLRHAVAGCRSEPEASGASATPTLPVAHTGSG